jgi:hypothetical protein
VSGADPIDTRPGFAAMLKRIEGNGVKSITVITIECYSNDRLRRCPSVAGVSDGDSEQRVIRKLGAPDASRITGVTKSLNYRTLGLRLILTKEQVYGLAIHDPKYQWQTSN